MMPGRNEKGEPNAIDVYLDESSGNILKTFHCLGCGFVSFQYFGRVKLIMAATAISHRDFNRIPDKIIRGEQRKAPTIYQCKNSTCKLRYNVR